MRLTRLLMVVILVLMAGRTAASQDIQTPKTSTVRQDYVRPFVAQKDFAGDTRPSHAQDGRRVPSTTPRTGTGATTSDDTCLTLHTLVVARESKGSDSTRLVSQHTCTPARQFQMKSAVVNSTEQR